MTDLLRVLLVEDQESDALLVLLALRAPGRRIEHERVEDVVAMRAALEAKSWDLVLSDWSMPKFCGLDALALVKEMQLDVPFIIVSGTVGEDSAVEAMRAGAHDYVLKDRLTRLGPAVDREVRDGRERVARRQAEESLRQSEARFSRLSECGIIGILIATVDGVTLEANDAYLKMIGFTREELLSGKIDWGKITPPEWHATDAVAVAQLQATGVAPAWEKELFRKDGTRIPVLIGVAMLDFPKCIAFLADLSARKLAETALRRSEDQLRHAQKMEAVGRLAGGIAHDFNNLLSVILSYASLLRSEIKPEDPMHADFDEIAKAAERAANLTRQLMLFSRQQVVQPKVINLNELLGYMDKMLHRLVGEDVDIVLVPAPVLGPIKIDPGHVEQVVMNLVVNARDAMPGGGTLTIQTEEVVLDDAFVQTHFGVVPGPHVLLSVTDTGTGMAAETQARIFEPFFTTKGVGKGTGLGLSTVFGIVQQAAGHIWVESELGRGTTFKVWLPVVDAALDSLIVHRASQPMRGTETVLLVEDEDQVRIVARGILSRYGYHVLEAPSPGEALLISEGYAGVIHLLLTDVIMPHLSGPELAKRLAATRGDMKIIYMSGYTDDSVTRHGILEARMAFIQKPFTPESLAAGVREALDGPRRDLS